MLSGEYQWKVLAFLQSAQKLIFIIPICMLLRHVLSYAVHRQDMYMFLERKGSVYNTEYLFVFFALLFTVHEITVFVLFVLFSSFH